MDTEACPICLYRPITGDTVVIPTGDLVGVDCPRCGAVAFGKGKQGSFNLTGTADAELRALTDLERQHMSSWLRIRNEEGADPITITSDNLRQLIDHLPQYRPREKQNLLLRAIERRTQYPGHRIRLFPEKDHTVASARGVEEFSYLLTALGDRQLIEITPEVGNSAEVRLTPRGWDYIEEMGHPSRTLLGFVAMSFSEGMRQVWLDAIKPAINTAGYNPYRVDDDPSPGRIDARIEARIREARFLVADVTEQRPGVYFEAGFAMGLGLPVIFSVRRDDLHAVHFDTRQYRHIVWETPADLRAKLVDTIKAMIG